MNEVPKGDIGVIVGRFQVHELHAAHRELIESVRSRHRRVIIILGLSPLRNTLKNPLDFRARKAMIQETYSDVDVLYIQDVSSNEVWSTELDRLIATHINPTDKAVLYGSRDSFIDAYSGKYPTALLESKSFISGSEIRREVQTGYKPDKSYRAGVIAATAQRFPVCYQTVDVVIFDEKYANVLLVRKPNSKLWQFVGGFSDINSPSLEADARREVAEEVGVDITDPEYVGSMVVDDWRYRSEDDKIKTAIFVAKYVSGTPEGKDDVAEARWFQWDHLKLSNLTQHLIPEHRDIARLVDFKTL